MPNIQICGFSEELKRCAEAMKEEIDKMMREIGLEREAITDIIPSKAESCEGGKVLLPYIRICSTDPKEIKKIIAIMKKRKVHLDVEWLVLSGFIPRSEMLS